MSNSERTPYGSWKSPITADLIVGETVRLGQIALDGENTYWIEMRPAEGGRNVIVKHTPDGKLTDMTPAGFNARTRVHEYGGGAFAVNKGTIYFSNDNDQRIYKQTTQTAPEPLTPKKEFRYADAIVDEHRNRLICVREDHTNTGQEAVNSLVSINLADGADCLITGAVIATHPGSPPTSWTAVAAEEERVGEAVETWATSVEQKLKRAAQGGDEDQDEEGEGAAENGETDA